MSKKDKRNYKQKPVPEGTHSRAFKYRAFPTDNQEEFIKQNIGSARKVWNLIHEKTTEDYKEWQDNQENPKPKIVTPAYFKKIGEYNYLKDADSRALVSAELNYKQAWQSYFKNPEHFNKPRFKAKNHSSPAYTTEMINKNIKLTIDENNPKYAWLRLPKLNGSLKVRYHRKLPATSEIRKVTVKILSSGKVYVSLLTRSVKPEALPTTGKTAGIDLGLTSFLILNDGTKIENPKYYKQQEKKLARLQKKASRQARKAKQSGRKLYDAKNYQKTRIRIALLHEKIKNSRLDYQHKLSLNIVREYDFICLENLNISGMLKNHCLAKSIQDAGWGEFVSMLEYKADWYGKSITKINQYYPSTKTCSKCEQVNHELTLKDREWECKNCEASHDRDKNAAINIHNEGLKGWDNPVSLDHSTASAVITQEAPTSKAIVGNAIALSGE